MATKPIGTLGTVDTLTVGGRVLTDVSSNLIVLTGYGDSTNRYTALSKLNSSGAYQVTAGKTLTIVAARITIATAASGSVGNIGYGTAAAIVGGSGSPPSGATWLGNAVAQALFQCNGPATIEVGGLNFTVPATDYPCAVIFGGSNAIMVWGYEA